MSDFIKIEDNEGLVLNIPGQRLLLDSDIAWTSGCVTRAINKGRLRELSHSVKELSTLQDKSQRKMFMQRSGELREKIVDAALRTSDAETAIELNFAILKFRHSVKKRKGDKH